MSGCFDKVEKHVTSGFCDLSQEDEEMEPWNRCCLGVRGFLLQHLPVQRLLGQDRNIAVVIDGVGAIGSGEASTFMGQTMSKHEALQTLNWN